MGLPPCRFTSTFEVARLYAANLHLGQSPVNQKPIKHFFSAVTHGPCDAYWRIGNGKKHDRPIFAHLSRLFHGHQYDDENAEGLRLAKRVCVRLPR